MKDPNPVQDMSALARNPAGDLVEKFIAQKAEEFSAFSAAAAHIEWVRTKLRDFENGMSDRQQFMAGLRQAVEAYLASDIPKSLFQMLHNDPSGLAVLHQTAGQFAYAQVLQTHGPALVKLAENDLAAYAAEFKKFKHENKSDLAVIAEAERNEAAPETVAG